jgi:hypothetical protein
VLLSEHNIKVDSKREKKKAKDVQTKAADTSSAVVFPGGKCDGHGKKSSMVGKVGSKRN